MAPTISRYLKITLFICFFSFTQTSICRFSREHEDHQHEDRSLRPRANDADAGDQERQREDQLEPGHDRDDPGDEGAGRGEVQLRGGGNGGVHVKILEGGVGDGLP